MAVIMERRSITIRNTRRRAPTRHWHDAGYAAGCGRAGHSVGAVSEGIIFPKFRADLVACAAVTRAMHDAHIESTRFPRNPLDVLCQQMVAIVAHPPTLPPPEKTTVGADV